MFANQKDLAIGKIVCTECGSDDVQIPVWKNPNTGEVFDDFGSFNEPDARYCAACDKEGRDPNPSLVVRCG